MIGHLAQCLAVSGGVQTQNNRGDFLLIFYDSIEPTILCRSQEFANRIKSLRQYGWNEQRESVYAGFNSRLDELQAAILRVKLKHLTVENEKRRLIAQRYNHAFQDLPITLPYQKTNEMHAMHLYVIECERRNELLKHLRSKGVGASLHYPLAVHQHAAYANRIRGGDDLPMTEHFYQKNLTLPMFPELTDYYIEKVISTVKKFFQSSY